MLKNNIKMAWRSLRKEKLFSAIKIGGFAVGVAVCLLIALFVMDELSYDKHFPEQERIYRIAARAQVNGVIESYAFFPPPMASALKADFPEIIESGRMLTGQLHGAGGKEVKLIGETESAFESGFVFIDQSLFEIWSPDMSAGSIETALSSPHSIAISQSKSELLYPDGNALGQQLILDNDEETPYTIGGVYVDFPENSHLKQFDYLITMTGKELWEGEQPSWDSSNYGIYIKTGSGVDPKALEKKLLVVNTKYILPKLLKRMNESNAQELLSHCSFIVQPIADVHLRSNGIIDNLSHGDIRFVWLFAAIALFVLILACINFINLSTAKSANRAKEVGLRKTVGAFRSDLLSQFLTESVLFSILSFVIGLILAIALLPLFNDIASKSMMLPWSTWWFIPTLIGSALSIGLLAGIYPAFYLSAFRPAEVLKGSLNIGSTSGRLRSVLVIFQFTTSIILIIGTLVVYQQMQFILNKDIGYDKDKVMIIKGAEALGEKAFTFKEELLRMHEVKEVTMSNYLPVEGTDRNGNSFWKAGRRELDQFVAGQIWRVDHDYVSTLDMRIIAGRDFSKEMQTDREEAIIINETMAKHLGLDSPVGEEIINHYEIWTVIGIVEDFHFNPLTEDITPLAFVLGESHDIITLRLNTDNTGKARDQIASLWQDFVPYQNFRSNFLNQDFNRMHIGVQRMSNMFNGFTLFALLVACLGLFALSAFMVEQRKKEISIRLVLGASFKSIYTLLSFDFLKLVLISILIAAPIGWYIMQRWLEDYAYRIDIGLDIFLLSGAIALVIAILTISYQSIGAALTKPLDGLRME